MQTGGVVEEKGGCVCKRLACKTKELRFRITKF